MSASAYLLKQDFRPSVGLDRTFVRELWHVIGIVGWTPANTRQVVFSAIAIELGKAHIDPGFGNAICTNISLADGPWVSQSGDGTMEALVLVTYDSDRRWGAAGYPESGTDGGLMEFEVPCFSKSPPNATLKKYDKNNFMWTRAKIVRTDYRDGTGMIEADKTVAMSWVGKLFNVYSQTYILSDAKIVRMATNQTIIKYVFTAFAEVRAFQPNGSSVAVPIPALARNDRYIVNASVEPPEITVRHESEYGQAADPTLQTLPYWDRRLY